jgi:hypothetical protein
MKRIVSLAIVLSITSCGSPESKYEEACSLIGERDFEASKTLLQDLSKKDIKNGDPAVARFVCEVGLLAKSGKFSDAYSKLCETDDESGRYKVIVHPDDPLHLPALNLALWIKAERNESIIKEFLAEDPETESYGMYFTEMSPSNYAEEVLSYDLPDYTADESFEGGDFSVPRIMYASFKNTKILPAYTSALDGVKSRYEEYYSELLRDAETYTSWSESQAQALEEQNASMDQWIQGKWISDHTLIGNRRLGINIGDEMVSFTTYWANGEEENSDYYYYIVCDVYSSSIKIIKGDTREVFERRFLCNTRGDIFERVEGSKMSYAGGTFSRVE